MNTRGEGITVTIPGSGTCVPSLDRSAADMAGQCRKTWAGPLLLARDLMQIPVRR